MNARNLKKIPNLSLLYHFQKAIYRIQPNTLKSENILKMLEAFFSRP